MGSVLEEDNFLIDNEIWPDPLSYLTDPADEQLKKLEMDNLGFSKEDIISTDIIRDVLGVDFYGGLIDYLEANGYEEGKNLFIFPYDWRLDLNIIAGDDSDMPEIITLKEKIEEVINKTGSGKVDIIAHSMGGLVVKTYAQKYGQEYINKFIDIATPHLGAPEAAKILNYGDNLGMGLFINNLGVAFLKDSRVKEISQKISSIYQLLPSESYFSLPGVEYGNYLFNDNPNIDSPTGKLNYYQSMQYLNKTGEDDRTYFINKNSLLHSVIDDTEINNSFNIVGCGRPTIGRINDLGKKKFFWDKYKIEYIDGDGTVPLRSADYYGDKKYYYKGKEHSKIPGADGVKELIYSILNNQEENFDFTQYSNFKENDSICGITGKVIEYHCPVEMHIYDAQGNHTGPTDNGDIENNIPGVQYDIVGDNKFAFLPEGENYTIVGEAESAGALEVEISGIENNQYEETIYFNDILLDSDLTNIKFDLADDLENQLINIDKNGDGDFEEVAAPDSILNQDERKDLTKPTTDIIITGTEGENNYYNSDMQIELTAEDDNSGILKTEYSLDNGQNWIKYSTPFFISQDGEYEIIYASTDRAGNREAEKKAIVKIDKTKPEILILTPDEAKHNEILDIVYLIDDNFSGVNNDKTEVYWDNNLISSNQVDLFSQNIGIHKIKILAEDIAGNKAEEEKNINVITDIQGTILDINRAYREKMINDKSEKELIKDLENIQKYINKYGKRGEKRDKKQEELLSKCIKRKGKEWCENQLGKIFKKINYHLDFIHIKVLKTEYNKILQKLELYYRKGWVTEEGYVIIKEDIKYLISKL